MALFQCNFAMPDPFRDSSHVNVIHRLIEVLQRLFATGYSPEPQLRTFLSRGHTQETSLAEVTVAVLSAQESRQLFGVSLASRSIQPVFLHVVNRHAAPLRLNALDIDPHYYTPLEAASINHFSIIKRLSAFGIAAFYFLPLVALLPLKLLTGAWANRRMDACFTTQAFPLRPILPGENVTGFIYTTLDAGSKTVRVRLSSTGGLGADDGLFRLNHRATDRVGQVVDLTFVIPVPGLATDSLHQDFSRFFPASTTIACNELELAEKLLDMPAATTNKEGVRSGDPVNLVVIGALTTVLSACTARWDECETLTLNTCWKTFRAFVFGDEYRYSPVSPLHLFGRSQDVALQRIRSSINERLHLRLWLTPLEFSGRPVWVGQISRDIGVRFTTHTWNFTTHRVDPNVDESRDYIVEDLLRANRVEAVDYVEGVGACRPEAPRHNLTGDPYFTDGKRAVIVLSLDCTARVNAAV